MTWEIQIGKEFVVLDSDKIYSGKANPIQEEKLIRKAVGLPVTKQLVYYKDKHDPSSVVFVHDYRIKVRLHSVFFAEMQKPSFVADMIAQEANVE